MGGRDHSCDVCGRGGFNDPGGACICPDEMLVVATLFARSVWREGTPIEILRATERVARDRAKQRRYTDNPVLDAEVAKLARKIRKRLQRRDQEGRDA